MKRTLKDLIKKEKPNKFINQHFGNYMKYIIISCEHGSDKREHPFIFPQILVHADVADYAIGLLLELNAKNCTVVSAGECNFVGDDVNCEGGSDSIGVKSRGEKDSKLIQGYNYFHGTDSPMNDMMLGKIRRELSEVKIKT